MITHPRRKETSKTHNRQWASDDSTKTVSSKAPLVYSSCIDRSWSRTIGATIRFEAYVLHVPRTTAQHSTARPCRKHASQFSTNKATRLRRRRKQSSATSSSQTSHHNLLSATEFWTRDREQHQNPREASLCSLQTCMGHSSSETYVPLVTTNGSLGAKPNRLPRSRDKKPTDAVSFPRRLF